jgi:hypothetical protein
VDLRIDLEIVMDQTYCQILCSRSIIVSPKYVQVKAKPFDR